jgi:hypothetical protein
MSYKYYTGQSVVESPRKKDATPEKTQKSHAPRQKARGAEKRERIEVVNGKLMVVRK